MDISFKPELGTFNHRAGAIIINQGKVLVIKDERSPYYYLPGGRVGLNETLEAAVLRELKEELDIEGEIIRPLWLNQSFFTEEITKEKYHELCLYFLIDISKTDLLSRGESFQLKENNAINRFKWLKFKELKTEYFHPDFIKEKIFELPDTLTLLSTYG